MKKKSFLRSFAYHKKSGKEISSSRVGICFADSDARISLFTFTGAYSLVFCISRQATGLPAFAM